MARGLRQRVRTVLSRLEESAEIPHHRVGAIPVSVELRIQPRQTAEYAAELIWKDATGEKRFENCRAVDCSDGGVAVECPVEVPLCADLILRAEAVNLAALSQVRHCTWRKSSYLLGLQFLAKTSTSVDPAAPDHYEILRLSQDADDEAIGRVYRTLAKRFHPDNPETADAQAFLRINQAWRILSDPAKRARYDAERLRVNSRPRFRIGSKEFFQGLKGEQYRRLAILCMLYRKRMIDYQFPAMSILDLEQGTGFTREEIGFALWYLREKGFAKATDDTQFCISAAGMDYVEGCPLHPELLAIAAPTIIQGHLLGGVIDHSG
jgi:curved DNA-binding protein